MASGRVGALDSRGVMSEEDNVKFVRRLWAAIGEGGLEAALELTAPEVEWRPHPAGGQVLTSQDLLRFYHEFQGERQFLEARPYSFHAHGDLVLASGSFRLRGRDRMAEFQIHFVYEFENGTLQRATTYATRGEALQAMGLDEVPE
jgi:ketosteroid isomerase-like protein